MGGIAADGAGRGVGSEAVGWRAFANLANPGVLVRSVPRLRMQRLVNLLAPPRLRTVPVTASKKRAPGSPAGAHRRKKKHGNAVIQAYQLRTQRASAPRATINRAGMTFPCACHPGRNSGPRRRQLIFASFAATIALWLSFRCRRQPVCFASRCALSNSPRAASKWTLFSIKASSASAAAVRCP